MLVCEREVQLGFFHKDKAQQQYLWLCDFVSGKNALEIVDMPGLSYGLWRPLQAPQ